MFVYGLSTFLSNSPFSRRLAFSRSPPVSLFLSCEGMDVLAAPFEIVERMERELVNKLDTSCDTPHAVSMSVEGRRDYANRTHTRDHYD